MIRKATQFLRRFRKEEDGQMMVEFALAVPLIFTMFLTSVEMGIYAVRQNFLDRGLDMAIRDVRLNTGANYTHKQIKDRICGYAGFLTDCDEALKLQMTPINPRSFSGFAGSAECADVSLPVTPSLTFVHGSEHQLMLMRACYMFEPVFPTTGLGYAFTKDGTGRVKMVSLSGFVQEPST
ncbi:TadE family protein [uncultured Tateyamaria sp.]|uniref:TadE/TadG family type IV pilus assembly protein n=1 Tax=uncultured Tateyamaria sp. TaxID=455651 RepID=UPI002635E08A|nr:TadE family protein [uncultured Tateyamaria sp.]